MKHLEHWNNLLRDIEAPQEFIDWAFRWLICASLQRRVWVSLRGKQLYPNIYLFLVAEPGIGKSITLSPAKELLSWHKYHDKGPHDTETIYRKLMSGAGMTAEEVVDRIMVPQNDTNKQTDEERKNMPLFAVGPDSTTYEQLVQDMAGNPRMIRYQAKQRDGTTKPQIMTHNSFCFASTELSNLIKKGSDSIVNLMLEAYDCAERYEYRTKHHGKDCVHRVCLNFAAGTTPDYMSRTFDDSLLNEGISSRSFFIFAFNKRFYRLETGSHTDDQIRSKASLLAWLRVLGSLYGEVTMTPEARDFLKFWYEQIHPTARPNKDPKMIHYYSRKELHVVKTAMAVHFADSTDLVLTLEDFQKAFEILEHAEKRMHLALQVGTKNPLANIARKIIRWFVARGNEHATQNELIAAFYSEARSSDLIEVIQYMMSTNKLVVERTGPQDYFKLNPLRAAEDEIETRSDTAFIETRQVVHDSLDRRIRWGRGGKVILPRDLPGPELLKLRTLMRDKLVSGVSAIAWE